MINVGGIGSLGNLAFGNEELPEEEGMNLQPRTKGPRRLLMDLLRQDPAFLEIMKASKLKGVSNDGSMDDYSAR
jgi:hypothetical protein